LGVEEIAVGLADVFGEEATGDVFVGGRPGDKKIDTRRPDVGGPGDGLGPGAGGEMKGESGKEVLERRVEIFGMALADVHQVEIVVGEDGRKVCAHGEDVAMADEDGFNLGEFCDGFGHDLNKL